MPLHSTGVGLILLAHAPAEVQEAVLAGDLSLEPAESIWPSGRDLRAVLAAVRRDGVAVASRLLPEPATSVAAPITDRNGAVAAALSVVTRSDQTDPAVLRPAVVAIARAVSRALAAGSGT